MWACVHSAELSETISTIVDVMSDDTTFAAVHYPGMEILFEAVNLGTPALKLAFISTVAQGVGVGHRQVVSAFACDAYLLTRAPELSVEDEVEPIESPYMAFSAGHHVKLQLTADHVRQVTAAAAAQKGAFVLLDEFHKLCCVLKIESKDTPVEST